MIEVILRRLIKWVYQGLILVRSLKASNGPLEEIMRG